MNNDDIYWRTSWFYDGQNFVDYKYERNYDDYSELFMQRKRKDVKIIVILYAVVRTTNTVGDRVFKKIQLKMLNLKKKNSTLETLKDMEEYTNYLLNHVKDSKLYEQYPYFSIRLATELQNEKGLETVGYMHMGNILEVDSFESLVNKQRLKNNIYMVYFDRGKWFNFL